jgi:hypothetical protein
MSWSVAGRLAYQNFMFLVPFLFAGWIVTSDIRVAVRLVCWVGQALPESSALTNFGLAALPLAQFISGVAAGLISRKLLLLYWIVTVAYFLYFLMTFLTLGLSDGHS